MIIRRILFLLTRWVPFSFLSLFRFLHHSSGLKHGPTQSVARLRYRAHMLHAFVTAS